MIAPATEVCTQSNSHFWEPIELKNYTRWGPEVITQLSSHFWGGTHKARYPRLLSRLMRGLRRGKHFRVASLSACRTPNALIMSPLLDLRSRECLQCLS